MTGGDSQRAGADSGATSAAWGRFKDDCPECGEYACVCRESEEEARLLNLWVTMPNYVRIVYGFVPPGDRT